MVAQDERQYPFIYENLMLLSVASPQSLFVTNLTVVLFLFVMVLFRDPADCETSIKIYDSHD